MNHQSLCIFQLFTVTILEELVLNISREKRVGSDEENLLLIDTQSNLIRFVAKLHTLILDEQN